MLGKERLFDYDARKSRGSTFAAHKIIPTLPSKRLRNVPADISALIYTRRIGYSHLALTYYYLPLGTEKSSYFSCRNLNREVARITNNIFDAERGGLESLNRMELTTVGRKLILQGVSK